MKQMLDELHKLTERIERPLKLMEVCGTHTVEIFRHGVRDVIPKTISLLSGPGCPVCVTSVRDVDTAIAIAKIPGLVLATFGDMMRVPGGQGSLIDARSLGADVRVLYSPMDALNLATEDPGREVVFFATGFETTSPLIAATIIEAEKRCLRNFTVFSAHKLVPPALTALLESPDVQVDGFILPGHVSAIIGKRPYEHVPQRYGKPSVITGFEAQDIVQGILMIVRQIASGKHSVENQYGRVVRDEGNPKAVKILNRVFEPADAQWRGIGMIPDSGLKLRKEYAICDAVSRFNPAVIDAPEPELCACGDILRGVKIPTECPLFGTGCTPDDPVGPCMVSTEGSCAAYYKYGEH
ncbi:MAG TPA: hydrogenase formation protein HypD [Nitrospiraceae bacterium]|nr:MAG: hydrogenase formation protein HypD [Nitrospirae bacterium GWC1_57_7]OGW44398.1 MAG: hydrogenase formation protein HypD [Nitrospirae bacterium GWD2_57_8]HAR44809.1 hydrogenase formation protein HypD [Nitrospiraceae bacterium]HAS55582.1 hydrogenase formation protein HypD [Nitrospiraceae bacterium]